VNNKALFEEWLTRFKRNINGKKFNAVKSYMRYMGSIEKHLNMEVDGIYEISALPKLQKIEVKLRTKESFTALAPKSQANLLSAFHVYQNLMEILSNNHILNLEDGKPRKI
jgi:regulator of replication initiation timing